MLVGQFRVYGLGESTRTIWVSNGLGEGGAFARDDIEHILQNEEPRRSRWLAEYWNLHF